MDKYGYTKEDALRAYNDELPALLPDGNKWKHYVEDHRWGYHTEPQGRCPACQEGK